MSDLGLQGPRAQAMHNRDAKKSLTQSHWRHGKKLRGFWLPAPGMPPGQSMAPERGLWKKKHLLHPLDSVSVPVTPYVLDRAKL